MSESTGTTSFLWDHIGVTTTVRGGRYSTTTMRVPVVMASSLVGGVGVEGLGAAAHGDHHLAESAGSDAAGDPADLADHLLVSQLVLSWSGRARV